MTYTRLRASKARRFALIPLQRGSCTGDKLYHTVLPHVPPFKTTPAPVHINTDNTLTRACESCGDILEKHAYSIRDTLLNYNNSGVGRDSVGTQIRVLLMKKRYIKKVDQIISAVQLSLATDGFRYDKWGGTQQCRSGDWIVDNNGDCYTISPDSFAATYQQVSAGRYRKVAPVWAELASEAGRISTHEGSTDYAAGDYIVYNGDDDSDGYAVAKETFEAMYISDN